MSDINSYLPHVNMYDEFSKSLIKEFVTSLFKKITLFSQGKEIKSSKGETKKNDVEKRVNTLINTIFNWSNETQFFGLSIPLNTDQDTICLNVSFNLREYTDNPRNEDIISESDLFSIKKNFFIYGDPGSGKTTTLKRLIANNFFSKKPNDYFLYPYVIRLKEIPQEKDLYTFIVDEFGFKYESISVDYEVITKVSKVNTKTRQIEHVDEIKIEKRLEYFVGDIKLERFVADFFESSNFFIALDGLDEVNSRISAKVQKQIEELASQISNSKIVVTCRPGYLERKLNYFAYTQICDLDEPQIIQICNNWIENTQEFLENLKTKSYFELTNKPLFLSYLLVLFKNSSQLPESSKEVYEEIIDFFLVKWDRERGITRTSKYANFSISAKKDFLTHLSFHLTYKIKAKIFSKSDFVDVYKIIYKRFGLPEEEASEISAEIESHTGIIVKAFFNKYEFCHLSLQEHLCANYIRNDPFTYLISNYLRVFPSPLALVIAHSTNPSSWFANIILTCLKDSVLDEEKKYLTKTANILLNRIIIERPYFEKDIDFGMSLNYISTICLTTDKDFENTYNRFFNYHENIGASMILALEDFKYIGIYENINKAIFKRQSIKMYTGIYSTDHIDKIGIPLEVYKNLVANKLL